MAVAEKKKTRNLGGFSTEEMAAELRRRKEADQKEKIEAQNQYEVKRDLLVKDLVAQAFDLNKIMTDFKSDAVNNLDNFKEIAQEYGDVRSNSKGGFSLRSRCGNFKVAYERNTKVEYDERANMGENLIREFLTDMVKVKDKSVYELITGLLERGKDGKFNPAAVAALVKMEDKYKDDKWQRAIKLFKESHNIILIGMNVSFFHKDEMEKDEAISLTFAALPVTPIETIENQESSN